MWCFFLFEKAEPREESVEETLNSERSKKYTIPPDSNAGAGDVVVYRGGLALSFSLGQLFFLVGIPGSPALQFTFRSVIQVTFQCSALVSVL